MRVKDFFPYGAVFKIDRSFTHEHIRYNLQFMKDSGMNFVVIWPSVYWWEDRSLPGYPFNTGKKILEFAEDIGLKVIMEFAGQVSCLEYAPDFVMKPEYYSVDEDNNIKNKADSYDQINYNHPEVKQLILKNYKDIVKAYKHYPSLYGYDIWNETMFRSYDIYTLQLFRKWLQNKYVTIDKLNDAWERTFYDWSQIDFSYWCWASIMSTVDYHKFQKENVGMILDEWNGAVKEEDPDHVVIADNIGSMIIDDWSYQRPQDDWNVARNVDEYGISYYPKNVLSNAVKHSSRWATLVGAHSASPTGRFWIAELQSHHQTLVNPCSAVDPHELRWWNWETVSHGAKGLIYWKWDPFVRGHQVFGRGLITHDGRSTPRLEEASSIAKLLQTYNKEFTHYEPEQPAVAILYDKHNHDFLKAYTKTPNHYADKEIYTKAIEGLFNSLWENNIAFKFITQEDLIESDLCCYNAIFATQQVLITEAMSDAFKKYMSGGGIVIVDGMFGTVNKDGILYSNLPGGPLNEELGIRLSDVAGSDAFFEITHSYSLMAYKSRQLLELTSENVKMISSYDDGKPAITFTTIGKGGMVFIATSLWHGYGYGECENVPRFMDYLNTCYKLKKHTISDNRIKYSIIRGNHGLLLFLFNYNSEDIMVDFHLNIKSTSTIDVINIYNGERHAYEKINGGICISHTIIEKDVSIFKVSF